MFTMTSLPPVHRYLGLIAREALSRRTIERRREPSALTDTAENVFQYDQVMSTKLAIAYALGVEAIYCCRQQPFGGAALDIACGPGHMSLCMATSLRLDSLIGVDLSPPMIATAKANAEKQQLPHVAFELADATDLHDHSDASIDLCTFCDAAHHMLDPNTPSNHPDANRKDLGVVTKVLREMDRVTRPDGLVFVMDLVRFKSDSDTEQYVELVGRDYHACGMSSFYDDFRNSMYAAWSLDELRSAIPSDSTRNWHQWSPRGLSTIQFLIATPSSQSCLFQRKHSIRKPPIVPLTKSLLTEWQLARQLLLSGMPRKIQHAPLAMR